MTPEIWNSSKRIIKLTEYIIIGSETIIRMGERRRVCIRPENLRLVFQILNPIAPVDARLNHQSYPKYLIYLQVPSLFTTVANTKKAFAHAKAGVEINVAKLALDKVIANIRPVANVVRSITQYCVIT